MDSLDSAFRARVSIARYDQSTISHVLFLRAGPAEYPYICISSFSGLGVTSWFDLWCRSCTTESVDRQTMSLVTVVLNKLAAVHFSKITNSDVTELTHCMHNRYLYRNGFLSSGRQRLFSQRRHKSLSPVTIYR